MKTRRTIWLQLLKRHRAPLQEHLQKGRRRQIGLETIAGRLIDYMRWRIQTPADAGAFWRAVPPVISRCDEQETYELDMASEAYAWIHLLDRYVRTWLALEQMLANECLPLAGSGVNVLDVGTGPGPNVFAIADFYRELSAYGRPSVKPS